MINLILLINLYRLLHYKIIIMKTFITAALFATLKAKEAENSAFLTSKWMLAPDFIAGFMYGMTKDNNL